jgi:YesN/AraC family two-component response regulator
MEKLKVIIVEDEPPIARFINMLTEEDEAFQVISICESAEAACKVLENEQIHLLITDIRITGMSGIDLIKKIRKTNQKLRIIIISGFKMFEYAKEAIQLGIEDYITKPINPNEFQLVLNRVKAFYQNEAWINAQDALEKAMKNSDEKAFLLQLSQKKAELLMLFYGCDVEEKIDSYRRLFKEIYFFIYKNAIICIDLHSIGSDKQDILHRILNLQNGITSAGILLREVNLDQSIMSDLRNLYRAVRKLAVPGKRKRAIFEDLEHLHLEIQYPDEDLFNKLIVEIKACNWKQFRMDFNNLFQLWKKDEISIYRIETVLHKIIESLYQVGAISEESIALNEYVVDCVYFSNDYQEIYDSMLRLFDEKFLKKENKKDSNGTELFESIYFLIENNPESNISLQEISTRFAVSQPYIRKIFKNNTGMTYNEYVIRKKMEIAKELISLNPDILIKNVADAIGFEQMYFSTIFNKYVGVSPSQYKILLRANE